ncbi:MAG: hypothetical protein ACRD3N_05345 [Terracidiphilus sp.]
MTTETIPHAAQPVRGTQELVDHMGWVVRRPLLTLLEIAWRWVFAIPFLYVCWGQMVRIGTALPPDDAGLSNLSLANPWLAAVRIGGSWVHYELYVVHVLYWLAPLGIVAWSLMAGLGRTAVLKRMEPGVPFRPLTLMVLQGGWLVLLCAIYLAWYESIQRIAAAYISPTGAAELVGYSIWAIFLSLGFFSLWAVISWPFTIAPILALLENRSALSALRESLKLGRPFTNALIETNLSMGIAKLCLIVLAMVLSAAPLPFAQELGPGALRAALAVSAIFYCVAGDYFQVVRLKTFVEFWRTFRGEERASDVVK